MSQLTEALVTIMTAIIGVAILSVLVSRNAQTPAVLQAFGQSFSNLLSAATGPVTGRAATPNVGGSSNGFNLGSLPSLGFQPAT